VLSPAASVAAPGRVHRKRSDRISLNDPLGHSHLTSIPAPFRRDDHGEARGDLLAQARIVTCVVLQDEIDHVAIEMTCHRRDFHGSEQMGGFDSGNARDRIRICDLQLRWPQASTSMQR
jgi:hypothetical protein